MAPVAVAGGLMAAAAIGAADSATSGQPAYITLAVALLAGGVGVSLINGWLRKRSGEGPASAADSLSQAAGRLATTAEDLVLPLQRANANLVGQVAELQSRLAMRADELLKLSDDLSVARGDAEHAKGELRLERHRVASEMAALGAQLATCKLIVAERDEEIQTLQIELGRSIGRRSQDPPDPPAEGTPNV